MLNNTTDKHYCLKSVESAIDLTESLTEGTEDLFTCYRTLKTAADEGCIPLDVRTAEEMEQLLTVMNKLSYQMNAALIHFKAMRIAEQKAEEIIAEQKAAVAARRAAKAAAQAPVIPAPSAMNFEVAAAN